MRYRVNTEACKFPCQERACGDSEEGDRPPAPSFSRSSFPPACHPCCIGMLTLGSLPSTLCTQPSAGAGTEACGRGWLGEQERCGGGAAFEVGRSKARPLAVDNESEDAGLWLEGLAWGSQGSLRIPGMESAPSSRLPGVSGLFGRRSTGVSSCKM